MRLSKGEKIILDDGPLGFRKKLMLTNKRLVTWKGQGLFNTTWKEESEIPLVEIEEAYVDTKAFTAANIIRLRMKDGSAVDFQLKLSDSQMVSAAVESDALAGMSLRSKSVSDRWANEINRVLKK